MKQNIQEILKISIQKAISSMGVLNDKNINIEHPEDMSHGDFSSNVALVYSKDLKINPKQLAENIVSNIKKDLPEQVLNIDIAGPGFINFYLKPSYFIKEVLNIDRDFGKNKINQGKEIMVEYTDPNPFKIFHIGHLMTNAIGESISRLIEFSGAKTIRACYQGDVGMHVAKTVWGIIFLGGLDKLKESENISLVDAIRFMGNAYVIGDGAYNKDDLSGSISGGKSKQELIEEITEINKKIFTRSDKEINKIYDAGKKLSLQYFDKIYEKLGTSFNNFFFESEVSEQAIKIVNKFLDKGIFEKSDGATIFPGEKYGEHTRVFINSHGLPTYEAKEIGLTFKKFNIYPSLNKSIVVSANEINTYFKVIITAMKNIDLNIAEKMMHIGHGILRPSSGKMSSRKGNVVSAEDLIKEFKDLVDEKMTDRDFSKEEKESISESIAISGIKYMILRQAPGGDVIYDPKKALSFEGDSGPYLQYATVRAKTVLRKAHELGIKIDSENLPSSVTSLEKKLLRFSEVVERAQIEYAPQFITSYLTDLAGEFNSYYANNQIIDQQDKLSPYRLYLTNAFVNVMTNGLWILGIKVPERM